MELGGYRLEKPDYSLLIVKFKTGSKGTMSVKQQLCDLIGYAVGLNFPLYKRMLWHIISSRTRDVTELAKWIHTHEQYAGNTHSLNTILKGFNLLKAYHIIRYNTHEGKRFIVLNPIIRECFGNQKIKKGMYLLFDIDDFQKMYNMPGHGWDKY